MYKTLYMTMTMLAMASSESLLDQFVSTFTQGSTEDSKNLLNLFADCGDSASTDFFSNVFKQSLNATRECWTNNIQQRATALKCIKSAADVAKLSNPYDFLSAHEFNTTDIADIGSCATGIDDNAALYTSIKVVSKRFLQCKIDSFTSDQENSLKQIFGDATATPSQQQNAAKAQLESLCTNLKYAHDVHTSTVSVLEQTLKHFVEVLPSRRR
jgi:hypothetical protein